MLKIDKISISISLIFNFCWFLSKFHHLNKENYIYNHNHFTF